MPKNPQAFPRPLSVIREEDNRSVNLVSEAQRGMTLRDYFAIRATQQDIEFYSSYPDNNVPARIVVCSREKARYRFADAMLLEREKPV